MRRLVLLCLTLALSFGAPAARAGLPVVRLSAGLYLIRAEVAADYGSRARGLMYRRSLAANAGMLFVFDAPGIECMWMKNTLIPLSVAFLDRKGRILNIAEMSPQTEDSHCSAGEASYALEMNAGWFAERGIKPGSRLGGIPSD